MASEIRLGKYKAASHLTISFITVKHIQARDMQKVPSCSRDASQESCKLVIFDLDAMLCLPNSSWMESKCRWCCWLQTFFIFARVITVHKSQDSIQGSVDFCSHHPRKPRKWANMLDKPSSLGVCTAGNIPAELL